MQDPSEEEKRRLAERAAAIEAKYAQAPARHADQAPELPAVRAVQDGDETSLNVSDTNALRASLGLKPLTAGSSSKQDDAVAEHRRHWDRKRSRDQEKADHEKREQLAQKKEERRIQNMLKKTRGLGTLDGDDDEDFLAFMSKPIAKKPADTPQQPPPNGKPAAAEDETGAPGVKVRGSAADLQDGESVILTLADADILTAEGALAEDTDVLEEGAKARQSEFERRKRAAQKQAVHFEEDGMTLGMLSKYDAQQAERLIDVDADGTVDAEAARAELAARLTRDAAMLRKGAATAAEFPSFESNFKAASAYLTPEEQAAAEKPSKRKKRMRRRGRGDGDAAPAAPDGDRGAAEASGDVFAQLEAAADEASEGADDRDRGSRAAKRRRDAEEAAADAAAEAARRERYERALERANHASSAAALAREAAADEGAAAAAAADSDSDVSSVGGDDEDDRMRHAMAVARRAQQVAAERNAPIEEAALANLASEVVAARAEDEKSGWAADLVETNETKAFIDALKAEEQPMAQVKEEDVFAPERAPGAELEAQRSSEPPEADAMDAEEVKPDPASGWTTADAGGGWSSGAADPGGDTAQLRDGAPPPKRMQRRYRGRGGADKDGGGAGGEKGDEEKAEDATVLFEAQHVLGRGLAEALTMVRERGWLHDIEFSGRQSDFKGNQKGQVEDALLSDETALAHRVGASLQRTDEFGRILTPKESFRDVSYAFHGYHRAASKKEKGLKKLKRDRAQSGLTDDKNVPYHLARNPSQLVDDFKARKWKPQWVKGGGGDKKGGGKGKKAGGKRDEMDRFVEQAAAAARQKAVSDAAAVVVADPAARRAEAAADGAAGRKAPPPPPPAPPPPP